MAVFSTVFRSTAAVVRSLAVAIASRLGSAGSWQGRVIRRNEVARHGVARADAMLILLAAFPILLVGVLMVGLSWPSRVAMPAGYVAAALIALLAWDMPVRWLVAATIGSAITAVDILLIVFGALLILQMLRASGGLEGINRSMAGVSRDRRIQLLVIAWLMGGFLEGAAGFGTPAAVGAPLLVGMGFPPLVAAITTLMADSTSVTFGAGDGNDRGRDGVSPAGRRSAGRKGVLRCEHVQR